MGALRYLFSPVPAGTSGQKIDIILIPSDFSTNFYPPWLGKTTMVMGKTTITAL